MFENHLILKRNSKFLGNEAYCGKTKMVLTDALVVLDVDVVNVSTGLVLVLY